MTASAAPRPDGRDGAVEPRSVRGRADVEDRTAFLLVELAQRLHVNGQDTDDTIHAVSRLGRAMGFEGALLPNWDRVELLTSRSGRPGGIEMREAVPAMMSVDRVSSVMAVVDELLAESEGMDGAEARVAAVAGMRPPPVWAFAGAAALGATALAVSFGETELTALLAIAVAGLLGGCARRAAGAWGAGLLVQNAVAGAIAGSVAALCMKVGLAGDLRLVALCPCMILLPGPHLLNGVLDVLFYRMTLGISRLAFALTALTAISAGLVVGLGAWGDALPAAAGHVAVPFWRDAIAGGVAAICYGVFYAMPPRMLVWPACIGLLAHGADWSALTLAGLGIVPAVAVASLVAGSALVPVARRFHLPFAGIGFASVVSMLPGIFLFPMSSDLVAIAQRGTASPPSLIQGSVVDGTTAIFVVLGMTLGLLCPKSLSDALRRRRAAAAPHPNLPGEDTHG